MNNPLDKIISRLNYLISISHESKNGYQNAAQYVQDRNMKDLFLRLSNERTGYAQELRLLVKNIEVTSSDKAGLSGYILRTWMDIKAAFTPGCDETVISACIPGEETAIKAYTETLNKKYITGNIRAIINGQLNGISAALQSIVKYGTGAVV